MAIKTNNEKVIWKDQFSAAGWLLLRYSCRRNLYLSHNGYRALHFSKDSRQELRPLRLWWRRQKPWFLDRVWCCACPCHTGTRHIPNTPVIFYGCSSFSDSILHFWHISWLYFYRNHILHSNGTYHTQDRNKQYCLQVPVCSLSFSVGNVCISTNI